MYMDMDVNIDMDMDIQYGYGYGYGDGYGSGSGFCVDPVWILCGSCVDPVGILRGSGYILCGSGFLGVSGARGFCIFWGQNSRPTVSFYKTKRGRRGSWRSRGGQSVGGSFFISI